MFDFCRQGRDRRNAGRAVVGGRPEMQTCRSTARHPGITMLGLAALSMAHRKAAGGRDRPNGSPRAR